jgi:hypothetical protein
MTRTFEEMCKARDPLYAAMQTQEPFTLACLADKSMALADASGRLFQTTAYLAARDAALLLLAVRALRNQGQPYYRV